MEDTVYTECHLAQDKDLYSLHNKTRQCASNHRSFQPYNFPMLFANVQWNYGFRKHYLVELC